MSQVRKHQATHTRIQTDGDICVAQTGMQRMPLHMDHRGADQHTETYAHRGLAVHRRCDAPDHEVRSLRGRSRAAVRHGTPEETSLVNWPFLYSYRGGRCFVNAAQKKTAYAQAADVGEALI